MVVTILAAVFGFSMGIAFRQLSRLDKKLTLLKKEVERLKSREIAFADKEMLIRRHDDLALKVARCANDQNSLQIEWVRDLIEVEGRIEDLKKSVVALLNSDLILKKQISDNDNN
jgi:hypothetical protein